ncbi:TRAP transporter small permease subunit [Tropicimonas sp. S265A]|uniref:TRAP transporter small permease subunit n=1 Tax=Tropicimonas sp. S265A TaxID=3415134 RepID=UPI003C7D0336
MEIALRLADRIDWLTRGASRLAAALLLALVALVFFNVFGRYVVGASPIWAQELEWHLMAPIALLGITVLMLENGHVRVDMVYDRLSPKWQSSLDLFSMICGVVIACLFIKYSWGFVDNAWSIREGSPDPGGLPARYLVKGMIPVAFALFALQCAANAIRHAAALKELRHG